jgi:hypothetical protein
MYIQHRLSNKDIILADIPGLLGSLDQKRLSGDPRADSKLIMCLFPPDRAPNTPIGRRVGVGALYGRKRDFVSASVPRRPVRGTRERNFVERDLSVGLAKLVHEDS